MRALWSLPKAAPALLRHLAAYGELVALDVRRAHGELKSVFIAAAICAVFGIFSLALACLAVIAYYWDTPYRVVSICSLAGGFLALALILLAYSRRLLRARAPFLGDLHREWQQDKVILEHALSSEEPR